MTNADNQFENFLSSEKPKTVEIGGAGRKIRKDDKSDRNNY